MGPDSPTFDDGPDATWTWTPIILRELDRLGARATVGGAASAAAEPAAASGPG